MDESKKPKLSSWVIEKLTMVLTNLGVPDDIIEKIKSILWDDKQKGGDSMEMDHPDTEDKKDEKMDMMPEWMEKSVQESDPKKKLSLNGVRVVCISE